MGSKTTVKINTFSCSHCGLCVKVCDSNVLTLCQDSVHVEHPERCGGCGICEDLCPKDAISCEFAIVWDTSAQGESSHAG